MNGILRASLVSATLLLAATAVTPAQAGGLNDSFRGSLKDFGYAPPRPAAGPCYVRADVGYSITTAPEVTWPVNSITREYAGATTASALLNETFTFITDDVTNVKFENSWFGDVGVGCGQGSSGFRFEGVVGYRSKRKIDGVPGEFTLTNIFAGVPQPPTDFEDPIHTSLTTYTAMLNVYRDLGKWGRFVPYVGAGIGLAYHKLDEVYFTENPFLTNRIEGNNEIAFAWSLMAGAAYQLTDRAILDVGYRYMDFGSVSSGRIDSGGFANPPVDIEDITAHEIKVGMRYHFGSSGTSFSTYK